MSDVDDRLREVLHDRVTDIPSYWEMPSRLKRRARRRIALTFGGTLLAVTVVAFGAFAGIRSFLRSDGPQPAQFVPKANGEIAFVGRSVADWDLNVVDPSTGETRILVSGCPPGGKEGCAAWIDSRSVDWSPDGTRLAYTLSTVEAAGGAAGIYVIDVGSGETTRLTTCSDPCWLQTELDWSPDGKRIAYTEETDGICSKVSGFDGTCSIHIVGLDGSDPVELPIDLTDPVDPSWSPDGLHIAFTARQGEHVSSIYTVATDGSDLTSLATGRVSVQPAWSPDGSTIAFIRSRADDYATLWTVAPDGSDLTPVVDLGCCAGGGSVTFGPYPAWSPDGTKIAVISGGHLLILDRGGNELADLGEAPGPPSWRPLPQSGEPG